MVGNEFHNTVAARTAQEAFAVAVAEAKLAFLKFLERFGDNDEDENVPDVTYAGNLAAKEAFGLGMELPLPDESALDCVNRCMSSVGHWAMEFDNPAACVDGGADPKRPGYRTFHFFGLARG